MLSTFIVLISLLPFSGAASLVARCKDSATIKSTEFNIKTAFLLFKDSTAKVDGGFTASVIARLPYDGAERTSVIKRIPLELASDVALLTQYMPRPGTLEDKFVGCLIDGKEVYVLKTCYDRSELCESVREEPLPPAPRNRQPERPKLRLKKGLLSGEIGKLNEFMPLQPEEFRGADFAMRTLTLEDGHSLGVLTIPFDKIAIREVKVAQVFSKFAHAPAFRGCFRVDKTIHFVSDKYPNFAAAADFTAAFRQSPQAGRTNFYRELAEAVAEFEKTGYVHNDVRPSSFAVDSAGVPRLVNFVDAKKRGGKDVEPTNRMFASPLRLIEKVADGFSDVYSLCASIVALESPLGEFVFNYDPATGTLVSDSQYPRVPGPTERHFETVVKGTLEPKWGPYDPTASRYSDMNLTTLVMRAMVGLDRELTAERLAAELRRLSLSFGRSALI